EEIRRALIQAGQRLSRHIRREHKAAELEKRIAHIEQFAPILVEGLCKITGASEARKKRAQEGLRKILGRDAQAAEAELEEAQTKLNAHIEDAARRGVVHGDADVIDVHEATAEGGSEAKAPAKP